MPELPVKEVRLSELHLPEIKRDEIVRSLSEVRVPTLDLAAIERPKIELPEGIRRFDWRSIDLTGALAGAAAIVRLGRPIARRSRWPLVAGAVIVVGATAAIIASPALRERAGRTIRDVRARIDERTRSTELLDVDVDGDSLPAVDAVEPLATTVLDTVDAAAHTEPAADTKTAPSEVPTAIQPG